MIKKTLLAAGLIVATASFAQATDVGSFYIGAGAGVVFENDTTHVVTGTPFILNYDYDAGFALQGLAGMYLPYNLVGEVEVAHRSSQLDGDFVRLPGPAVLSSAGDLKSTALMANLLYNAPVTDRVDLFAGGGIGVAFVDLDARRPFGFVLGQATDTRFAYQLIAGASFDVSERSSVFLRYSYLDTVGDNASVFNTGLGTNFNTFNYDNHSVFVGMKFKFK